MSAHLKKHFKQNIYGKYILEINIWTVEDKRYAHGVKYSLVFVEPKTGRKVLMDNHHPKLPHYHLDDSEFEYSYLDEDKLFSDFEKLILMHFGVKL